MLVGLLGISVPIVIHLIDRNRAPVVQFAALDFLLGSDKKLARRFRLRELLLLAVRVLVCLAIPLILAKPYASCATSGPRVTRGPQAAVLVIDNSYAAGYRVQGKTLLSRARRRAAGILDQLGPEADVAILLAAQGASTPAELSRDHMGLRDRIDGVALSPRPADTTTALRRASQLLAASHHQRRTVFLLSPLASSGFRPDEMPWAPGAGPLLSIVDVSEGADLPNLAVTRLEVEPDPNSGSRGVKVVAEIVNFGTGPVENHGVDLRVDGHVASRGTVSLRPGERKRKQFLATLPRSTGATDVVVALDDDALALDNRRYIRAELREEVHVLLVNGDPHTVRYNDELFYMAAALRPGDRSDSGTALTTATLDELPKVDLSKFDAITLANVRALPQQQVERLSAWVKRGGGLLITSGDNVDADAYNRTMQPLMPQQLRTTLVVAHGSRGAERAGRAQRLTKLDTDHPVFSIFTRNAPGLREAKFNKLILLGPTTKVDRRHVLARFTNGAAALVEARSGAGRVMFFSSSIDRDWNDLPIHPGYLPLSQQLIRYLARKQTLRDRTSGVVGRSESISVSPDDTRIEVRTPSGKSIVLEGSSIAQRKRARFAGTDTPGFYRVSATGKSGEKAARPESDFAINIDARGSDLTHIDAAKLPTSGSSSDTIAPTKRKRRVELWHAAAVGLLFLMLLESVLILRQS